jgi:5,5'-dehydrodivanillate O-demethylase
MGELLRRYWWPIAGESEISSSKPKPIRLLGEDLVLLRTTEGRLALLERQCAHRRADLCNGFIEAEGIRCSYHGWLFGTDGTCLHRPFDDAKRGRVAGSSPVRLVSYSVQALGGLVWAYLGPEPAPLLPDWEFFSWPNGFRQIVISRVPCNWFQCQENSIDPVHFEWQHGNWSLRQLDPRAPFQPTHTKLAFEEFEYGYIYRRLREDTTEEHPLWKTGRVCLWPAALYTGNRVEYRVPIDDENTLSVVWCFSRVPNEKEPYVQASIPAWHGPVFDSAGDVISSHLTNQDFMAWLGQGRIADRTRETLCESDRGLLLVRKRFIDDLRAMQNGLDPKATIRVAERNVAIKLPVAARSFIEHGTSLESMLRDPDLYGRLRSYIFQAGQPPEVRKEFEMAMGIDGLQLSATGGPADILSMTLMR